MKVAVIYEESYVLYGQRHERDIWDVIVQRPNESSSDFHSRVDAEIDSLHSEYSHFCKEICVVDDLDSVYKTDS